jgi:hypothetical protein
MFKGISSILRKLRVTSMRFPLMACAIGPGAAWSTGCAGDPMPPSRSLGYPANAGAPEAPMNTPIQITLATAASPIGDDAAHAQQGAMDASVVYTCPMHPEVRSNAPGSCPKCGMTLVPKKP